MVVGQMAPRGGAIHAHRQVRYRGAFPRAGATNLPDYRVRLPGQLGRVTSPVLAPLRWGVFFAQEQRTSGESWVRRGRAPSFSTDATIGNVLLLVHLS